MVFPNVEFRLTVNTRRGGAINVHLLVSPEDPDHVARAKEALSRLEFSFGGEGYPCSDEGLRRLGRAHSGNRQLGEEAALREGAGQFKVELSSLRSLMADGWAHRNIVMAIAAGQDGLGGLAQDSMWGAARKELGSLTDVVFSGQQTDIDYWLGRKKGVPPPGIKPCLHGSDAHWVTRVLRPVDERLCWIRGDASFEALRQALVEPEHRVFIGPRPPSAASQGEIIANVRIAGAPWLNPSEMLLNDGLVTVIGAKGSGKTALADLISLAADTVEAAPGPASFLDRARSKIEGLTATAVWADGSTTAGQPGDDRPTWLADKRVLYLSQQFVERLATPQDLSEPLVDEIERVVFSAIPVEDRMQAPTFGDLREIRMRDAVGRRDAALERIQAETAAWLREDQQVQQAMSLTGKAQEGTRIRATADAELARAQPSGDQDELQKLTDTTSAVEALRASIAAADRRISDLRDVRTKLDRLLGQAVRAWEKVQGEHPDLLDLGNWELLKPAITSEGATLLARLTDEAEASAASLRSPTPQDSQTTSLGLDGLITQRDALTRVLGLDAAAMRRRTKLQAAVAAAKLAEEVALKAAALASGARERRSVAATRRFEAYEAVFASLVSEEELLRELYRPLDDAVRGDRVRGLLRLAVARSVDIGAWAQAGEALFDLRTGPFQGRGSMASAAEKELGPAWRRGSPAEVRAAVAQFALAHLASEVLDLAHGATRRDVEEWLFGIDHIRVRYDIEYEGVAIANLSPGTRGVVLLTLYLALDEWDLRPLVIDQPEENLDPASVFSTLVPFFKLAARRRQIIMVTHNANLVVNTDSDQVIVATATRRSPDRLPDITYTAGGLEDPMLRNTICDLLEGGQDAFRKRSERYGIS
jgi:energy-coupling factor transporter ATP-binding protein EcfA2